MILHRSPLLTIMVINDIALLNTDAPNAVSVNNLDIDITSESFIVRWDAVEDIFPVTYTVRWYEGDSLIGMDSVDGLSYTVTELTANTSYTVYCYC